MPSGPTRLLNSSKLLTFLRSKVTPQEISSDWSHGRYSAGLTETVSNATPALNGSGTSEGESVLICPHVYPGVHSHEKNYIHSAQDLSTTNLKYLSLVRYKTSWVIAGLLLTHDRGWLEGFRLTLTNPVGIMSHNLLLGCCRISWHIHLSQRSHVQSFLLPLPNSFISAPKFHGRPISALVVL
jgi:hypothetical protein